MSQRSGVENSILREEMEGGGGEQRERERGV